MAVSNLRIVDNVNPGQFTQLRHQSLPSISDFVVKISQVEPMFDGYSYDQSRVTGSFTYSEPSELTPGREIHVDFEYRDGSKLFVINFDSDIFGLQSFINNFSKQLGEDSTVYRNLHAPEDALWDFIVSSDGVLDIVVLDDGESVSYDEVDEVSTEEVIGNYSIESATFRYSYEGEPVLVTYDGGSLQVESSHGNAQEYIIQRFEEDVLNA